MTDVLMADDVVFDEYGDDDIVELICRVYMSNINPFFDLANRTIVIKIFC